MNDGSVWLSKWVPGCLVTRCVGWVLKGPGVFKERGVFLGNPKDSVWEDWGTLRKIRGITTRDP